MDVLLAESYVRCVLCVKQLKYESDLSPLFSVNVKGWSYISAPSVRLNCTIRNDVKFISTMVEVA